MTHLDEGLLTALRDRAPEALDDGDAQAHLEECVACRDHLDALDARRADVEAGLAALDASFDLEAARAEVRDRAFPFARRTRHGRWIHRTAWIRAAGVALFLGVAGAAATLPISPLHRWVQSVFGPVTPPAAVDARTPTPAPTAAPKTTGIRLSVPGGPLRIVLSGVADGTRIEVRWVDGTEAAITAPVGSHFTSATGRLEARPEPGPVRVELPRSVEPATLEVEGRVYLTHTVAGVTVSGPVLSRDAESIVFRVDRTAGR